MSYSSINSFLKSGENFNGGEEGEGGGASVYRLLLSEGLNRVVKGTIK